MAKKDFDFIFKFLLICAVFLSAWNYIFFSFPKIAHASATSSAPFYDNFDSYSVGNLYGQGYWNFVGMSDPNKYKVRSDEGHWISDFNALFNSQGGFIAGTSTNAIDQGSMVFFLDVLITTSDTLWVAFIQEAPLFENAIVFQLSINRIDAGHYCVNFIGSCSDDYVLSTSTIAGGNFYKVGVSWDRSRQKIKFFNGSNWSSEYDPNVPIPWNSGIIGYAIYQNQPWTFYIDNITDINLEIPYNFSNPEDWYSTHTSRYATSTAFFSDFIGIMAPVFERVTGFAVGIKDIFNTDEAYETGYKFGAVLPAINGYIDRIDDFFGGFPLGTIFKWSIFVLVAIFIIRLIFKFIPFFG